MSLFGDDPEEMFGHDNGGMSEYQQLLQQERQDRLLRQQIRTHGEAAMQATPVAPLGSGVESEPFARSYVMKMPGESVEKKLPDKDPLKSLMQQMGLSQGPDIEQIAGTKKVASKGAAEKLPHYDKRGATPLTNPQKLHFLHPQEGAHGLCLSTGFAGAWVGGVSSGKTTCLLSCLAHNHSQYRYKNVFLMHPDAEAARAGEYGLCDDIKTLDHFPAMDWWEKNSPGRTALIIDDASWALSKKHSGRPLTALAGRQNAGVHAIAQQARVDGRLHRPAADLRHSTERSQAHQHLVLVSVPNQPPDTHRPRAGNNARPQHAEEVLGLHRGRLRLLAGEQPQRRQGSVSSQRVACHPWTHVNISFKCRMLLLSL